MNPSSFRKKMKKPAYRDLFIIGVITILLIILGHSTHWTELVVQLLYSYQNHVLDDIIIPFIITALLLIVYIFRRNKEYLAFIKSQRQTEKTLYNTNQQIELLMRSSSMIIFRIKADADFTMIDASDNTKEIIGYSKDEMFEKHFWANHLHPDDSSGVFVALPSLFETGFISLAYRFKHKSGEWRWMQAELKCLYDENGKPYEMVGNWWDITKQKQIQDKIDLTTKRFELVSSATRDIIYDWDLITNELWMSNEIFGTYRYDKETLITLQWWEDNVHPDDHDILMNSIKETLNSRAQTWSGNYRFKKGDGTYADIYDRGCIVYNNDGLPMRWLGSMADITIIKKTEEELRLTLVKAEESARAKSEFLANMSHEIRTPLNGIVGMTELALDTELNAEQRRYLNTVKLSCDSLMSLINDILDFAKIDAGKLDITPVDFSLRNELPAVLQPLALKAFHKKLEFVFYIQNNVPDFLVGDIHRLQQIIVNLAGNAIKFTDKGEVVLKVALESITGDDVLLLFSVTDTGIGIPANKLSHVFEEFTQADGGTTRKYGGTGLGLAITKRLVNLMGGTMFVESKEGNGSIFGFTIKMKLQDQALQRGSLLNQELENMPVLVVEDNASSRECIVKTLENFRMKPTAVDSGEKAIAELQRAAYLGKPYPIMLLDISLAGQMDGMDVAEIVKADNGLQSTDIIVITMSQRVSDRERFAQMGINQYFTKPFSQSDILDSILNMLSLSKKINPMQMIINTSFTKTADLGTSGSYKILLVEDNLVNQEVAAGMLCKKGHVVTIANNGEEAVSLYKKDVFDLILMDVQMPVLNGYDATMLIRSLENGTGKHIPIIGLTANAMKGDKEKCLEVGMDEYVSKPIRMADLTAALDRIKQTMPGNTLLAEPDADGCLANIDTLLENLDGDYDVAETILAKFGTIVINNLEAMESCIVKGDINEIALLAHDIKGQCMLVDMQMVISLAGQIEKLAAENSLTELQKTIPFLRPELERGLKALEIARKKIAPAKNHASGILA